MTAARILQISNNASEEFADLGQTDFATKKELCEVIRYWQRRSDAWNDLHQKRMLKLAEILLDHTKEPHP